MESSLSRITLPTKTGLQCRGKRVGGWKAKSIDVKEWKAFCCWRQKLVADLRPFSLYMAICFPATSHYWTPQNLKYFLQEYCTQITKNTISVSI
jgi:hypothetical protein